jgi:alcohol dehydrogenase, propanol-preferring
MKMKAAVFDRYDGSVTIREVETPRVGPGEALIRVRACGLCGTDLKIHSGKIPGVPLPHIPGHEIAGEVAEIGPQVQGIKAGDRVAVHFYLTCGRCRYCLSQRDSLCENLAGQLGFHRNGGLAEFVVVPAVNAIPLGDRVPFAQAAILADAVATPYQALRRIAKLQPGEVVIVVGAGGLGLHAVQIAKALGARVLAVDLVESHLGKAAELGADILLRPERDALLEIIRQATGGAGAEVVIDLAGQPETLERDLEWLRPAGKLLVVGYSPDRTFAVSSLAMVLRGLQIIGCRASTRQDLAEVISWVEEKKIVPVVDDVLPLSKVNEAYNRLRTGKVIGRIVLEP